MTRPTLWRTALCAFALVALAGTVYGLRSQLAAPLASASAQTAPRGGVTEDRALRRDVEALREELAQLTARNAVLLDRVGNVEESLETASQSSAEAIPEPTPSEAPGPRVRSPSAIEQDAQALRQNVAQIDLLEDLIGSEPDDEGWAVDAENLLLSTYRDQEFEGAAVDSAHCRSSMCRVVVSFDTIEQSEIGFRLALDQMPWNGEAFFHSDYSGDRPVTSLYIAREGQALPRVDMSGGGVDF